MFTVNVILPPSLTDVAEGLTLWETTPPSTRVTLLLIANWLPRLPGRSIILSLNVSFSLAVPSFFGYKLIVVESFVVENEFPVNEVIPSKSAAVGVFPESPATIS